MILLCLIVSLAILDTKANLIPQVGPPPPPWPTLPPGWPEGLPLPPWATRPPIFPKQQVGQFVIPYPTTPAQGVIRPTRKPPGSHGPTTCYAGKQCGPTKCCKGDEVCKRSLLWL